MLHEISHGVKHRVESKLSWQLLYTLVFTADLVFQTKIWIWLRLLDQDLKAHAEAQVAAQDIMSLRARRDCSKDIFDALGGLRSCPKNAAQQPGT